MIDDSLNAIGLSYARLSRWNTGNCPPVTLEMLNGTVRLSTEFRVIAAAPAEHVEATYGRFGTLELTFPPGTFTLIDYPGSGAPLPGPNFAARVAESHFRIVRGIDAWSPVLQQAGIDVKGSPGAGKVLLTLVSVGGVLCMAGLVSAVVVALGRQW